MISFNNTELIEGVIADCKSGSDGILYSYSKNPKRTVENITENIALVKKITGGTKSSFSNLFMRLTYTRQRNKKVFDRSNHLRITTKRENG